MRGHSRLLVLLTTAIVIVVLGASFASAVERTPAQPKSNGWLAVVNYYRSTAHLPRVRKNDVLSKKATKHAKYMVRNDVVTHEENPKLPGYTKAGNEAGQSSNVAGWWGSTPSNRDFVEMWMTGPFHALGILRPNLKKVGYGVAHDDGGLTSAAALDVIHGLSYDGTTSTDYPIVWPGDHTTQPLTSYRGGEYPNPLSSCKDYSVPSGLPIVIQFAVPVVKPDVTFKTKSGDKLPACEVDGTNYKNNEAAAQSLGRALLTGDRAVLVIPKAPLEPGKSYVVKVTSGTETARSRFSISG